MWRFLRRAAVAVAAALGPPYRPRPFSGLFLASASPSDAGHLGLVRSRPSLRDLNSLLTREVFLLDATHALGAAALRYQPSLGRVARTLRNIAPKVHAEAEAAGDPEFALAGRLSMALLDSQDGCFGDALDTLARLADERPYRFPPRPCAAAVCDLLGRADEADRWLACVTGKKPPREDIIFHHALDAATLGGAPEAFAASQGAVAYAALRFIHEKLWGTAFGGDMSFLKKVLITGLLNRLVKTKLHKDAVVALPSVVELLRSGPAGCEGPGCPIRIFNDADGTEQYVLQASQALLSAVVLCAAPLSGERIRAVARAAECDLARAVEKGDTPAAADLRLLLALLAAHDGRFKEALERYAEAAREHPSDPRPLYLTHVLFLFDEQLEESDKWEASYERLAAESSDKDRVEHTALKQELVVALALGGARAAFDASFPAVLREIVGAAGGRVDAALVSALRDKDMPVVERHELRAVRTFVYAEMWSALKDLKIPMDGGSGAASK